MTYKIDEKVYTDDDEGYIKAIGGNCDDCHSMNRSGNVYIHWNSGICTWTPISELTTNHK